MSGSATADWWQEAAAAFADKRPPPRRGTPQGDAPAWSFADDVALASMGNLARVLVAMGLVRRLAALPRLATPLWFEARLRGVALRREMAGWPVFAMEQQDGSGLVFVCSVSGDWRTRTGAARGEGLSSLGAFMWGKGPGATAREIVRICGYRGLPRVCDLG